MQLRERNDLGVLSKPKFALNSCSSNSVSDLFRVFADRCPIRISRRRLQHRVPHDVQRMDIRLLRSGAAGVPRRRADHAPRCAHPEPEMVFGCLAVCLLEVLTPHLRLRASSRSNGYVLRALRFQDYLVRPCVHLRHPAATGALLSSSLVPEGPSFSSILVDFILNLKSSAGVGSVVLRVRVPLPCCLRTGLDPVPARARDCSTLVERPENVDDPSRYFLPLWQRRILDADDGFLWRQIQCDQQGHGRRTGGEVRKRNIRLRGGVALFPFDRGDRRDQSRRPSGGSWSESKRGKARRNVTAGSPLLLRSGQLLADIRGLRAEDGQGEDASEDYPVVGVSRRRSFLYRVLRALCVVHSLVPRSVSYVLISSVCVLIAEMNNAEALVLNRGEGQR